MFIHTIVSEQKHSQQWKCYSKKDWGAVKTALKAFYIHLSCNFTAGTEVSLAWLSPWLSAVHSPLPPLHKGLALTRSSAESLALGEVAEVIFCYFSELGSSDRKQVQYEVSKNQDSESFSYSYHGELMHCTLQNCTVRNSLTVTY